MVKADMAVKKAGHDAIVEPLIASINEKKAVLEDPASD